MLDPVEDIEALRLPAEQLGDDPRRHMGRVDAMPGIGLGVQDVGRIGQAPDLRQAVGADTDHAAPLVVDPHPLQLREHPLQFRSQRRADIARIAPRVVAQTAEQQAPVGGQVVVVEGHAEIGERHILRDDLAPLRLAQRLGRHQA